MFAVGFLRTETAGSNGVVWASLPSGATAGPRAGLPPSTAFSFGGDIHRSCAERAVVGKATAVSNQSRQSAASVQPGQLVEAQHLTHFGHLACWRLAPSAETIAH